MIRLRPARERLHTQIGWLDSWHTFSFADHYDPEWMGFRALRVINDDKIEAGRGFGMHPHRDMEIVSVVVSGRLEHRDSMGNGSILVPGEVQRMSAGSGVTHSEFNPDPDVETHLLQIWLLPEKMRLTPSYEQKAFADPVPSDRLVLLASPDARDGSVRIHQDVLLWRGAPASGDTVDYRIPPGRHAWLQMIQGELVLRGGPSDLTLRAGDGAAISELPNLELGATEGAEFLLFDLA